MVNGSQQRADAVLRKVQKAGSGESAHLACRKPQDCGTDLHTNCRDVYHACRHCFKTLATTAKKRSDIPFAGPPIPFAPSRRFTESGEPLGAGLSPQASTFTDTGSSALRSFLGLLFLTRALPNARQAASRLFVCLEHRPLEVLIGHCAFVSGEAEWRESWNIGETSW